MHAVAQITTSKHAYATLALQGTLGALVVCDEVVPGNPSCGLCS